jgi:signal transduction histidine kinase
VLLFANAMGIGDFGGGFLSGRSNVRLTLAFGLVTCLSLALLAVPFLASRRRGGGRKAVTAAAVEAPGPVMPGTAGELKMSVAVIEEGLEEFLEEEAPPDKEHLLVLYEETDRLKKIIAGMEELFRAKESARLARKERLQVEPLLEAAVAEARRAAPDKDIAYAVECEAGLTVLADRESLGRIVGNITDNAARFIRDSGSVTLTAGRGKGTVVLTVRDTGTGIRRSHLAHIYEHFFRGAGPGIGMGLSIVKELVDAFGGTIGVETETGKGTTVTVELPDA